jgi:hypothetical protein
LDNRETLKVGKRKFPNELFKELCTSKAILEELYGNAYGFEKSIVKLAFLGVEVTGTKLSTPPRTESSSAPITVCLFGGR